MSNMQLCVAHLLAVSDFRYLENSASGGPKTSFLGQKWLYFWSCLLSFKDIEHRRPPKDAPCNAAYFTYQAVNILINIGGLNWGNHLAKTGTEPAHSGFSWICYCRHGPKMDSLLTLYIRVVLATFIGQRKSDTLPARSWKWPSMECPRFFVLYVR